MKLGQSILMLALLGLLVGPLADVSAQTPAQVTAVSQAEAFAPGAPHGTWQQLIEPVRFYMDGTAVAPPDGVTGITGGSLTYALPSSGKSARITGDGADFALVDAQAPTRTLQVYRIDVTFAADCTTALGGPLNPEFTVSLTVGDIDFGSANGRQDDDATITSTGGGANTAATYSHTYDYSNGLTVSAANAAAINLQLAPANDAATCDLQFARASSRVTIWAESASVNAWTAARSTDTTPGAPLSSLPHASKVLPGQRAFELHVAYASAWPCLNGDDGNATTTACGGPDPGADRIHEMFSSGRLDLRIRNLDTAQVQGSGATIDKEGARVHQVGDSVQSRVYSVTYTTSFEAASTPGQGNFQFEIFSAIDAVSSNILSIGGKSFTIAPVGAAERSVNVGEPTTYRLLVTNTGTASDTITVSANVGSGGWDVDVLNGQVTVKAGAQAEVIITVDPPTNAIAGDSVAITATAASSFPQEVSPKTVNLKVTLTNVVTTGATMTGPNQPLEVFAGDKIEIPGFKIKNTGSKVGTYVVESTFIPAASGWRADAAPASRTINAQSVEDFSLSLQVSKNAIPGEAHVLRVQARLLGGSVPAGATVDIPISVIFEAGLDVSVREDDATRRVRGDASTQNNPDNDFDRNMVFRLTLANPTAVEQSFSVTNRWVNSDGSNQGNDGDCGSATHRGWTMAFGNAADIASASKARLLASGTEIMLQGGEIREMYAVLQWNSGLPADCALESAQSMRLTFRSIEDSDFSTSTTVRGIITAASGAGAKIHNPTFELARKADFAFQKTEVGAVRSGSSFTPAKFQFVVVNDGNEFDGFTVELPQAPTAGWTHSLSYKGSSSALHPAHPAAPACKVPDDVTTDRFLRCTKVGAGDNLRFELSVQPPANEPLGRTMTSSLIITSSDDSDVKDFATFRTRTVGQNDFAVDALRSVPTETAAGQTAALPFQIRNVGTAGDGYTLALLPTSGNGGAWNPRFSSSVGTQQEIGIPGGSSYSGFLLVEAPSGASTGTQQPFLLQVTSGATGASKTVQLDARVISVSSTASIAGVGGNNVLLANAGQTNDVNVRFSATTACTAEIIADVDSLPDDWRIADATKDVILSGSGATKTGDVTFRVTPPADALGTSTTAMRVKGSCPGGSPAIADLVLTLDVESGVDLALVSPQTQFVNPGGPTRWEMDVINTGLDRDTIRLATSTLPSGWSVDFESVQLSVAPIERVRTTFDVNVPADATPKSNVTFNILATSASDPSAIEQITVSAVVGFRDVVLAPANATLDGAPEESVDFVVRVTNGGTLSDRIQLRPTVATPGYSGQVTVRASPATVELQAGQVRDVIITADVSRSIPADVDVSIDLLGQSLFSPAVNSTEELTLHILEFQRADIDGDLVDEFAVDRNKIAADGFEEFRDSSAPGGRRAVSADLGRFLNDAAKAQLAAANRTTPLIDGDEDGRIDHFIDDTGDGLPDVYWDPDDEHSMRLSIAKDIDGDAVIDYFVDTDGDNRMDRLYNVVTGAWTPVIAIDGEGGRISYIVDANGNGEADADESVLIVSAGNVVRVTIKVDMDGDGRLDTVVDEDGDDRPDFFIRAGETNERRITLQDVNGDGVEDWTYDSNLDGRPDRYYDPVTQTGGHEIDRAAHFGDLVTEYWYVPVLFVLVVILFVVLVAVTRR